MSLVSEALRKARQEAAEKGAQQRGVVFRTTVVLGPKGTRFSVGWLAVLVAAAAALAGAGLAWWAISLHGRPAPAPAAAAVSAAAPGAPASPAQAAPPTAAPTAVEAPSPAPPRSALAKGEVAAAHPPAEPRADRAAAEIQPTGSNPNAPYRSAASAIGESAEAAPADGAPPAGPPAAPGNPSTAETGRERSFVLDADIGKVKLHLDYIVYRSRDPFASINGQEVVIGSIIEGFTVEEIGPESVRLRHTRGTVVLRAH